MSTNGGRLTFCLDSSFQGWHRANGLMEMIFWVNIFRKVESYSKINIREERIIEVNGLNDLFNKKFFNYMRLIFNKINLFENEK